MQRCSSLLLPNDGRYDPSYVRTYNCKTVAAIRIKKRLIKNMYSTSVSGSVESMCM